MERDENLERWDKLIKEGQAATVKSELQKINSRRLLRPLLFSYCDIARRVGSPELIIRWLRPVVRTSKPLQIKATHQELALYALGLLRLGAFRESYSLLKKVDHNIEAQVDFYLGSYFINQWDYQSALPFLNRYCRNPKIPIYQRLVGRLNRFACLVSLGLFARAETEYFFLKKHFENKKLSLLLGNLFEIRSQMLVLSGKHNEAQRLLENSMRNLKNADERSALYARKWLFILKLSKLTPNQVKGLHSEFMHLQMQASQLRDWETYREIEFYWFKASDKNELKKIYWGSRFQNYKQRVQNLIDDDLQNEISWIWPATAENPEILDPVKSARPKLIRKFLFLLTQELYSPIRSTELIDLLYSNEYFHPTASPMKFNRLLSRTRKWFSEFYPQLKIKNFGDSFLLEKSPKAAVVLYKQIPSIIDDELQTTINTGLRFTCEVYAKKIKKSKRTARRRLLKLVQLKLVTILKRGPRTYYQRLV